MEERVPFGGEAPAQVFEITGAQPCESGKPIDPLGKDVEGLPEGGPRHRLAGFDARRIRQSPMQAQRCAGKHGTAIVRPVTDRHHDIDRWCLRCEKPLHILRFKPFHCNTCTLQGLDRKAVDDAGRLAAGGTGGKDVTGTIARDRFCQNRSGAVAGAEEEDAEAAGPVSPAAFLAAHAVGRCVHRSLSPGIPKVCPLLTPFAPLSQGVCSGKMTVSLRPGKNLTLRPEHGGFPAMGVSHSPGHALDRSGEAIRTWTRGKGGGKGLPAESWTQLSAADVLAWLQAAAGDPLTLAGLIIGFSLVSEDATTVGAALLASSGIAHPFHVYLLANLAILIGDTGLYLLGRTGSRIRPLRRLLAHRRLYRFRRWLQRHEAAILIASRFMPGSRLPTYTACGFYRLRFGHFLGWLALGSLGWTALVFSLVGATSAVLTMLLGGMRWWLGLGLLAAGIILPHLLRPLVARLARLPAEIVQRTG